MKCYYINLDKAVDRKLEIEKNFTQFQSTNLVLTRFPAVDTEYVEKNNIAGKLRNNEKACFLSHKLLINKNIDSNEHLMVLEDDARFGKNTFGILEQITKPDEKLKWDIIFTDVVVPSPEKMIELIKLRKKLSVNKKIKLLNLSNFGFAGATSYVINKNSIAKVCDLLDQINLDTPIDIYFRKMIWDKKLEGYVVFPFITSLSNASEQSQIQQSNTLNTDLIWNTFRKMIWVDREDKDYKTQLDKIGKHLCDAESIEFSTIIAACISDKFVSK